MSDVWHNPNLFKNVDFSTIDKKVVLIAEHKWSCNNVISELNKKIDLDYVKASEILEGNTIGSLGDVDLDHHVKILYTEPSFLDELNTKEEMFNYHKKAKDLTPEGEFLDRSVVVLKENNSAEPFEVFKYPPHLNAVKFALKQAREDKQFWLTQYGANSRPLTREFIEKIHEILFASYIQLNTRLSRDPSAPPIKPAGYGQFRETVMINGNPHKYNVEVEGANWPATDSDLVGKEMQELIDNYNSSTLHPVLKALLFKVNFVKIHPFRDGNGRTSRILFNYMLVRYGIPTITIRGKQRDKYFDAMNQAIENENYKPLLGIVKKALNSRCDQYIDVLKENLADELNACYGTDDLYSL